MIVQELRFLLLLLSFTLHSCSMCSHADDQMKDVKEESADYSTDEQVTGPHSYLSSVGYPAISDSIPSEIIERICYSVSYNKMTRLPNWVMWELTGDHVMQRKEGVWHEYREDIDVAEEFRATLSDYAGSGYDRGHMCPGGDCNWNDEGRDETFLLTNICPQNPNLNRGDWKEIEIACRLWAQEYGRVYVVCGPIFFKSQEHVYIGENKIPVPEAFFKVVLCNDPHSPRGIGFICRNTDGNRKKDFYVNSIRQVERVTGYKFFTNISDSVKNMVYDMDSINNW